MSQRTTDKYVKIKKQAETAPENEIRIRAIPQIGRYISYAASLLLEKKMDTVLIKASGNAAKSACQIAEILRHRILGLHQLCTLKTISVVDEYEPREEGLDRVVIERKLAVLEITLSLKDNVLDTKAPGYQAPLPKEQVQEEELKTILAGRRGGRGGDRGGEGAGGRPRRGEGERGEGERGGRGGFRRGRYAGPRGRGGFGGRGRGGRGRGGRDYDDRAPRDYDDRRGGRDYDREDRGGYRGGRDYEDRRGGRDYDREDRGGDRGGYRGGRGGYRGGRGGYRGGRGGDRE